MAKQIHVVRQEPGHWAGKLPGGTKPVFANVATQREAIQRANRFALSHGGSEVVIHGTNGRIRETNTIGKRDPFPPRG